MQWKPRLIPKTKSETLHNLQKIFKVLLKKTTKKKNLTTKNKQISDLIPGKTPKQ